MSSFTEPYSVQRDRVTGFLNRARLGIAIGCSGACSLALVVRLGQPIQAVAGLLLALALPGWIAAEAAHSIRPMSAADWVMHVLGLSIFVSISIGAVLAVAGRLDEPELGVGWLIVTGILGLVACLGTGMRRHATSGASSWSDNGWRS